MADTSGLLQCTFTLNGQSMSELTCGNESFKAFSGLGESVNQASKASNADSGPIPPGRYYIFDRQSGGRLGWMYDFFSGRSEWFSLYAIDETIDDTAYVQEVKRGQFRLHPKGPMGISKGCVVLESAEEFSRFRNLLLQRGSQSVYGSELKAYGVLTVR